MNIATMILSIFSWIFSIIGFVGVLGLLPFSVAGIIFLAICSGEEEPEKKNSQKKKGIFFLILPWALVFGSLILLIILNTIKFIFLGIE